MNTEAYIDPAQEHKAWKCFAYTIALILVAGVLAFLALHGCQPPASAATQQEKPVRYILPDAPVSTKQNPLTF